MLRVKYGWAGEGRFWALNNMIAKSENCKFDLNKEYNKASIAIDLGLSIDEFNEFIQYLSEGCNLIINNDGIITTGIVQENLNHISLERESARKRYYSGKENENGYISPEKDETSDEKIYKVKESKVKEIKENEREKTKSARRFPLLCPERDILLLFQDADPYIPTAVGKIPVDDNTWFATQVIKRNRGQPINDLIFSDALRKAFDNLKSEDWFIKAGGLYWLLDVKAGNFNGENCRTRIAKYLISTEKTSGKTKRDNYGDGQPFRALCNRDRI